MKKILAILLTLIIAAGCVTLLASCGAKEEPETTAVDVTEEVPSEDAEEVSEDAEEASEDAEEAAEEASEDAEEAAEEASEDAEEAEEEVEAGLTSTDIKEVIAYYNAAQAKTKGAAPTGKQTMTLDGDITGDGALGAALKVAMPIITKTLEKNSASTDYIPGDAENSEIQEGDVVKATATSSNGVTTIYIQLKNQTDGPQADAHKAGPVARGIGTLGNVDNAINELGAEVYSGKETISLYYNDAYIKCTVNENTGKITSGTWHYKVNVSVANAELKLGIKISVKNLKACIDYKVAI